MSLERIQELLEVALVTDATSIKNKLILQAQTIAEQLQTQKNIPFSDTLSEHLKIPCSD